MIRRATLLGALLLLAACRPPKYALYTSPDRDFMVNVPFAWAVVTDKSDGAFTHVNFIGPFDARFFRGAPSMSVRWYAYGKAHYLPGGAMERYESADDFIKQTLAKVYAPTYVLHHQPIDNSFETKPCVDPDPLCILSAEVGPPGAKVDAKIFTVVSPVKVITEHFGLFKGEDGYNYNPRKHEYVVVPRAKGLYVLTYPATTFGYPKHKPQFNQFVNSFRLLTEGPAGPQVAHGSALPVKKS